MASGTSSITLATLIRTSSAAANAETTGTIDIGSSAPSAPPASAPAPAAISTGRICSTPSPCDARTRSSPSSDNARLLFRKLEICPWRKPVCCAGRIPVAGETIAFNYRASQRSITRIANATSIASETTSATPGTAQWLGKVLKPLSRSTADCESAALAVLSFATSRSAAIAGTYIALNPQQSSDVWPGDVLAITQNGSPLNVIVRKVEIEPASAFPEAITYKIAFANDWAEALGLTLSATIAADAILPQSAQTAAQTTAQTAAQFAAATVLPNLPQLQVVSATTTALQIDAGTAPPPGGGFEVRRRDHAFGPAIAQDLVLRSPVRSFSIPREAQVERYYIRTYDASTPPLYSRFSSAVFINLPTS